MLCLDFHQFHLQIPFCEGIQVLVQLVVIGAFVYRIPRVPLQNDYVRNAQIQLQCFYKVLHIFVLIIRVEEAHMLRRSRLVFDLLHDKSFERLGLRLLAGVTRVEEIDTE